MPKLIDQPSSVLHEQLAHAYSVTEMTPDELVARCASQGVKLHRTLLHRKMIGEVRTTVGEAEAFARVFGIKVVTTLPPSVLRKRRSAARSSGKNVDRKAA